MHEPRAQERELKAELRRLKREVQANGHEIHHGTGHHPYWVRGRSGKRIAFPSTPSDQRAIANLRSKLAREGVLPRRSQ